MYNKLKDSPFIDKKVFTGNKTVFETTEYTSDRQCVPCYLPIPIMKIRGLYKDKLSKSNSNKMIHTDEILTWPMEEAAEWCKEQLTHDEVKGKNYMANFNPRA